MSSLGKIFATDVAKEKDGVVLQYGDVRVRIARAGGGNDKFAATVEEITRPYRRMITNELLDPKTDKMLTREIFARAIVLEWNVIDDAGVAIECTPENIIAQFEQYPEFLAFVMAEAARLSNFRKAQLDAEAKN